MAQFYHMGSWGLPDFGVTEAIQRAIAPQMPMSPQGGSNLISTSVSQPSTQTTNNRSGYVANYPQQVMGPPAPTGGSTGSTGQVLGTTDNPQQPSGPSADDLFNQAWGDYTSQLDQQLNGLEPQKNALEATATTNFNNSKNSLTNTLNTNQEAIKGQQSKTLNDLTDALQSYWSQGNSMLGTRGASDSSAANMYSYALAKLGSKQRGDVMADYSGRLQNLKSVYDQNMTDLQNNFNTQVSQIGQWFYEAQNAIRGLKGQAAQQKGQQILDYGMQLLQQQQQDYSNKKNVLDTWAANHATSLQQLMAQMNQNSQGMPGYTSLFGNIQGGQTSSPGLFGFGNTTEKPLFPQQ